MPNPWTVTRRRRATSPRPGAGHRWDGDFWIVRPNFIGESHDLADGSRRFRPCEEKKANRTGLVTCHAQNTQQNTPYVYIREHVCVQGKQKSKRKNKRLNDRLYLTFSGKQTEIRQAKVVPLIVSYFTQQNMKLQSQLNQT